MARKKADKTNTAKTGKSPAAKKAGGRALITSKSDLPAGYRELLEDLKTRVRAAQLKAAVAVHRELIQLYWDIGRMIVQRQDEEGWGKSVVERLGADIQRAFPGIQGFSPVNVWRMRAFFLAYADTDAILSQPVTELPKKRKKKLSQAVTDPLSRPPDFIADLPWGHNQVLLFKLKEPAERLGYAAKAVENGWSRAVLTVQIETDLASHKTGEVRCRFGPVRSCWAQNGTAGISTMRANAGTATPLESDLHMTQRNYRD